MFCLGAREGETDACVFGHDPRIAELEDTIRQLRSNSKSHKGKWARRLQELFEEHGKDKTLDILGKLEAAKKNLAAITRVKNTYKKRCDRLEVAEARKS